MRVARLVRPLELKRLPAPQQSPRLPRWLAPEALSRLPSEALPLWPAPS